MYTVVPIYSYVQTDINDQIIAVTAVQWWFNGPFLNRSKEQGRKKNSILHLKSSDLTLIVSHQHLNTFMSSVLFRRLCRAQDLTHRWTRSLYRLRTDAHYLPCPPFISSPHLTQTNRPLSPHLVFDPAPHLPNGSNRLYGCLHGNRSVNSDQCCMF